jgi:acetyl esterase/lipase
MTVDEIHPDLRRAARWLPKSTVGPRTLRLIRGLTRLDIRKPPADVSVEMVGDTVVRVHRPASTPHPRAAMLWIHGGGYVIGTAAQDDALCRQFAEAAQIMVVAVDYRLAPEHPFPAGLQDCYAALAWLAARPDVDATRIAIGGASAGAGLAAALALMARDRGEVEPAFQLLAYPMLDDRTVDHPGINTRSMRLWNVKANRFGWQSYLGAAHGTPEISFLAAPSRSADLSGLPPAWVGVGTLDLFHDEDVAYARQLTAAGVDCELVEVAGVFHGFDLVRPKAGVAQEFRAAQVAALRAALK